MYEILFKFRNVSLRYVAGSEAALLAVFDRLARMGISKRHCRIARMI
jgi:hypothetical protein